MFSSGGHGLFDTSELVNASKGVSGDPGFKKHFHGRAHSFVVVAWLVCLVWAKQDSSICV